MTRHRSPLERLSLGQLLLENNVWGAPEEPHVQCIRALPRVFGWNLTRSSPSKDLPYYPEVIYGKKPWLAYSTTSDLPVSVDYIESLEVFMAVSMNGYDKHNLAFDLWITSDPASEPAHITDEIMIWFVWSPRLACPGILHVVDDGYNKYEHRSCPCEIKIDDVITWKYHQFTIKKQGIPSRVNLAAFLEHLQKEKVHLKYLAGHRTWK